MRPWAALPLVLALSACGAASTNASTTAVNQPAPSPERRTVALLLPPRLTPYVLGVWTAVEAAARREGLTVSVVQTTGTDSQFGRALAIPVEAIVVCEDEGDLLVGDLATGAKAAHDAGVPVVVTGVTPAQAHAAAVTGEFVRAYVSTDPAAVRRLGASRVSRRPRLTGELAVRSLVEALTARPSTVPVFAPLSPRVLRSDAEAAAEGYTATRPSS